ncbi:hypothetical protein BJX65DRAFT_322528 [Aspergillus insuetus]
MVGLSASQRNCWDRKDRNSTRVAGTCEWFTSHSLFQAWKQSDHYALLWVSADPGCRKSVLIRYLIDEFLALGPKRTVCYFFFKDDFSDQKSGANALPAVSCQFLMARPHLLPDAVLGKLDADGKKPLESLSDLSNISTEVTTKPEAVEAICILDAIDESVGSFYLERPEKHNLKFLVTSRPYEHIRRGFQKTRKSAPTIHLSGEEEVEIQKISHGIDLVIEKRVGDIGKENDLRPDDLTLDVIENMPGFTEGNIRHAMRNLPRIVDETYKKILNRSPGIPQAKRLLHIFTAAERPLSLKELSVAVAVDAGLQSLTELKEELGLDEKLHDRRVYLPHQTVKESLVKNGPSNLAPSNDSAQSVLTWGHCLHPEESHRALGKVYVLYLDYDGMTDNLHCFLNYAACHWPSHFREALNHEAYEVHEVHQAASLVYSLCHPESKNYGIWFLMVRPSIPTPTLRQQPRIWNGYEAIVKLILGTQNVGLNFKDTTYGQTPLIWAAEYGHAAVVKVLLDRGAAVHLTDTKFGQTPLLWAAEKGREEVVKLLLETLGVMVDAQSNYGKTALHLAAEKGHEAFLGDNTTHGCKKRV